MVLLHLPETIWFSPRERQVLLEVCRRRTNKEIAVSLGIAPSTVRNVISALLRKMDGLRDRRDLLIWAMQHPEDAKLGRTRTPGLHSKGCVCSCCSVLAGFDEDLAA